MRLGSWVWWVVVWVFSEVVAQARTVAWEDLPPKTRDGWIRLLHAKSVRLALTTDPLQEWEAVQVLAHQDPQVYGSAREHFGCRFPARWRYYFYGTDQPYQELPCEELRVWQNQLSIKSISFVYASAYLGNPASMFGHNFIRLNLVDGPGSHHHQQQSLLDYGIAFMAASDPQDWLLYVYKGLTGGYLGGFIMQPYYELLNHYAYGEGRNLWEVEVGLTPFERMMARDHLWEMLHSGYTPYYFTHVNCSSMLLEFMDAIKPGWSLRAQIGGFVDPPQAYKVVTQAVVAEGGQNLESKESFWPSSRTLFLDQVNALSPMERRDVEQIVALASQDIIHDEGAKVRLMERSVLETAMSWVQLRKSELALTEQSRLRDIEESLMLARLGLPPTQDADQPQAAPQIAPQKSPSQSHDPGLLGVGVGWSQKGFSLEMRGRLGHHDLLDPTDGFDPFSEVQYGSFQGSIPLAEIRPGQEMWSLNIVKISSFVPYTSFEKNWSWTVQGGGGRGNLSKENHVYGKGSFGCSVESDWFGGLHTLWSFLPGVTLVKEVSGPLSMGLGWTPTVSVVQLLGGDMVILGSVAYQARLLGRWSQGTEAASGPFHGQLNLRKNIGKTAAIDWGMVADGAGMLGLNTIWSSRL